MKEEIRMKQILKKQLTSAKELSLEIGITDHRMFSKWLRKGGQINESSLNKIKLYLFFNRLYLKDG